MCDYLHVENNMIQCRFCHLLNTKDTEICHGCGMPMTVVCPNCEKTSEEGEMACSCGFGFDQLMCVPEFVEQVKTALEEQNYILASDRIKEIEKVWRTHPQLSSLKKELDKLQKEYAKKSLNMLREYCDRKMYYTAHEAILQMGSFPQKTQLQKEISSAIEKTEQLLKEAERMQDTSEQIEKYMQILSICTDCETANTTVGACPPAPPISISMSIDKSTVHLCWEKLNSQYVEYCVIRKGGGQPTSITDGDCLVETSDNQFDDTSLAYGDSFYYAVYSKCGNIYSKSAARTDKPAIAVLPPEPVELEIEDNEKEATLTWPSSAKGTTLAIYVSEEPFRYKYKETVNLGEISLPKLDITGSSYVISKDFSGERYYLPVTIQGNVAVAGKTFSLISVVSTSVVNVTFRVSKSFRSNKYTIEISADSKLPGKLSLVIAERYAPVKDIYNLPSYLDIRPDELRPGITLSKQFEYARREGRGAPVYFRLIIANQKLARMVSINPSTIRL